MAERGNNHHGMSSRELRNDIERTRTRMDHTIQAIDSKMSVGQILDQLFGIFRPPSETGMRTGSRRVIDAARANPVPLALIGAGVAWMLIEERRGAEGSHLVRSGDVVGESWTEKGSEKLSALGGKVKDKLHDITHKEAKEEPKEEYTETGDYVELAGSDEEQPSLGDKAAEAKDKAKGKAIQAKDKIKDTAHQVSERMSETGGKAKEKLSHTKDRMKEAGAGARDKTKEVGAKARDQAVRAKEGVVHQWDENPLAMGAVALALGLIGGLALPSTAQEDRLFGRNAERVKGRLTEAGQEVLERGKRAASQTLEAAKSSAEQQGLHPKDLIEQAGQAVVQQVGEAGTRPGTESLGAGGGYLAGPGEPGPEMRPEQELPKPSAEPLIVTQETRTTIAPQQGASEEQGKK